MPRALTASSLLALAICSAAAAPPQATMTTKSPAELEKACSGGAAAECASLGVLYKEGRGVRKDERRAAKLFGKACTGGIPMACNDLAVLYMQGLGVDKDEQRAAALFEKACTSGVAVGCNSLGTLHHFGLGVDKDERRAATFFDEACTMGEGEGCYSLGILSVKGVGVDKDERRAATLFEKACTDGVADGCGSLGYMYREGLGVDKNLKLAFELFEKACTGGEAHGCYSIGRLYEYGLGVDKDKRLATTFYEKACSGGYDQACGVLVNFGKNPFLLKRERAKQIKEAGSQAVAGYGLAVTPGPGDTHENVVAPPGDAQDGGSHPPVDSVAITISDAEALGSLDKELIRYVIRADRDRIQYCYETQLTRFPKLSGKVTVKFVISAAGTVASSSVTQSTAGNQELEACVAGRVRTWIFPKPEDGGVVVVSYPFIFKMVK